MKRLCLALALAAASTAAQSFNVDVESGATGSPAPVFGGAAGRPGYWNSIAGMSFGPFALVDLAGSPTGVVCTRTDWLGGFFSHNSSSTNGYFQFLMDDAHNTGVSPGGSVTYTLNGLAAGRYVVFTYAWSPLDAAQLSGVTAPGSTSANPQFVGGVLPGLNTFATGITHAVHVVTIAAGAPLDITCSTAVIAGTLNGFQVLAEYEVAMTQSGNGDLTVRATGGAPGNIYLTLMTPNQGAFPNGALFGLDITIPEALNEMAFGPPFFGLLDANGSSATVVTGPFPAGFVLYCVGLEVDVTAPVIVSTTAPFSYTFL